MKTQLLATFTTKTDLDTTLEKIKGAYTIAFGRYMYYRMKII